METNNSIEKHSPLPWTFKEASCEHRNRLEFITAISITQQDDSGFYAKSICKINPQSGDEFDIVRFDLQTSKANAALIVRSVNCQGDLVEILEIITTSPEWIKNYGGGELDRKAAINKATTI